MSEEQIFNGVVINGTRDLAAVVAWFTLSPSDWCIVSGMAVDSYATRPIYTNCLEVATDREPGLTLLRDLAEEGFAVELDGRAQVAKAIRQGDGHRLRVVIHYGPEYRTMPSRAERRAILGRALPVASLPDVVAALLHARDEGAQTRAQVEAEMHLFRLAEEYAAQVDALLPSDLRERAEADRLHAMAYPDGDGWG